MVRQGKEESTGAVAEAQARRLERRDRVLELIKEGCGIPEVLRRVAVEHGVARKTVRRDVTDLGREARARLRDEGVLDLELRQALDRMRARAQEGDPKAAKIAQKADETLVKFLSTQLTATRLEKLGKRLEEREVALADLEERRLAAVAELAEAEAELARVRADNVAAPLVVVLRGFGGEISEAEVAAASPTVASRKR